MKHLWLLVALLPACIEPEQTAAAAAAACDGVSFSCYCTQTLATNLRCVDCTGTPRFVDECTPASGAVCCDADDDSICSCRTGTTCTTGTESAVAFCTAPSQDSDPSPGDSDGGDSTCANAGFCSVGANSCSCGTTCRNYNVSAYLCGYACATDDDCTSRTNPATKRPYSRCQLGFDNGSTVFDSYCVP